MTKICVCGCEKALQGRQTRFATPECQKRYNREQWVMKVYGITMEEYQAIIDYQGGRCPICDKPFKEGQTPHVDHRHGQGIVRGILHGYCNQRVLGKLNDHETAYRMYEYLKTPPAVTALGKEILAPGRPKKKRKARKRTK